MKTCKSVLLFMFLLTAIRCSDNKETITVLSFGGTFGQAQKEAYFLPFTKEFGVEIKEANYNGEYGKIEAASKTMEIPWDVIDIESAALMRGIDNGLFEDLDYKIIDTTNILTQVINKQAIGTDIYSMSLGYNKNAFKDNNRKPNTWADFWDVKNFPGFRSLKKDPKFNLEIALLADGVPIDQIYNGDSLDVNRAFKKLDQIKPYIKIWWTTGQQPIQLLADGDVVMVGAFGARLWTAENIDKRPLTLTWNQSIADIDYWVIPKGAKNKKLAMKFLNFALQAQNQANFSKIFPLGPTNVKAFDFIQKEVAKNLNTYPDNFSKHLVLNTRYWQKNEAKITERWNTWLLK